MSMDILRHFDMDILTFGMLEQRPHVFVILLQCMVWIMDNFTLK